jgi:hypothetical protein
MVIHDGVSQVKPFQVTHRRSLYHLRELERAAHGLHLSQVVSDEELFVVYGQVFDV